MSDQEHTYYKTLYEVARVINSSLEPADVLAKIAEQVTLAMNAKGCNIRLLDKRKRFLLAGASFGLSKGYLRKGNVEVEKSGIDKEALQGNVVYINNACNDSRFQYPDRARDEGFTSMIVVPLRVEHKIIGVLRVYSADIREFSQDEIDFLTAVANIAGIAIENARLHQALKMEYDLLTAYNYQVFED